MSTTKKSNPQHVAGVDLVPVLGEVAETTEYYYWTGLCDFEDRPEGFNRAMACGIEFPLSIEHIIEGSVAGGTIRTPQVGGVYRLNLPRIERVLEMMPRELLRWTGRKYLNGQTAIQPLRIPTKAEAEWMSGTPGQRPYVPHKGDRPLANFVFCVPVRGMERRSHSDDIPGWEGAPTTWDQAAPPPPLSVTGLAFPTEKHRADN